MQRLPLIKKASATVNKATHRTISAKSCLLFCVPPTRSLQSRAMDKQSLARLHCDHYVAAERELTASIDTHGERKNTENKTLLLKSHSNHFFFLDWCQNNKSF